MRIYKRTQTQSCVRCNAKSGCARYLLLLLFVYLYLLLNAGPLMNAVFFYWWGYPVKIRQSSFFKELVSPSIVKVPGLIECAYKRTHTQSSVRCNAKSGCARYLLLLLFVYLYLLLNAGPLMNAVFFNWWGYPVKIRQSFFLRTGHLKITNVSKCSVNLLSLKLMMVLTFPIFNPEPWINFPYFHSKRHMKVSDFWSWVGFKIGAVTRI